MHESIVELCGKSLITPNATRWNSTFDSIRRLLDMKEKFEELFKLGKLSKPSTLEITLLEDYVFSMAPLAMALDKLQGEELMYYGYLAPTIQKVLNELREIQLSGRQFEVQMAKVLVEAIEKRFPGIANWDITHSHMEIFSAVAHPYFKLRWVPLEKKNDLRNNLIQRVCAKSAKKNLSREVFPKPLTDDFFKFEPASNSTTENEGLETSNIELECLTYLQDPATDLIMLTKYPSVKEFFILVNTALPSSAPVERIFNYGGHILSPKRNRLNDDMFEMLVTLKIDSNQVD